MSKFNKLGLFLIICIIVFVIITLIFVGIYVELGKSVKTHSKTDYKSNNVDWLPNENNVVFTAEKSNQWHTHYTSDNGRKFIHVCSTTKHSSVYNVDDELITYYDNKVMIGREYSYLRNNKNEILYTVETGNARDFTINKIKIKIKYIVKTGNKNGEIIAYVSDESFTNENFVIKDVNGNAMVSMSRNKIPREHKWFFEKTKHNILPLSLLTGIASKISFREISYWGDQCSYLWLNTFIVIIVCLSMIVFLIIVIVVLGIQKYRETTQNNRISAMVIIT
jgi:hypothetical protein